MAENKFEIRWLRRAERDLYGIIDEILDVSPARAVQFGHKLQDAVDSLVWSPARCPRVKEAPDCRHLIVKKYRIIFEIDEASSIVWINTILFPYQQFKQQS